MIIVIIAAIATFLIFAYMRNKQAARNDERRERLLEKQEQLMETLRKLKQDSSEHDGAD